jgi:hypothetical protein
MVQSHYDRLVDTDRYRPGGHEVFCIAAEIPRLCNYGIIVEQFLLEETHSKSSQVCHVLGLGNFL